VRNRLPPWTLGVLLRYSQRANALEVLSRALDGVGPGGRALRSPGDAVNRNFVVGISGLAMSGCSTSISGRPALARTAGRLAKPCKIGSCYRGTSWLRDECRHLRNELVDVAKIVEPGDDDFVRNLNVLMHKHVSKSDRLPQCVREIGREHIVRPE
jgi:hypothetical protein